MPCVSEDKSVESENDIPTLEWPPQSPDLNIIEKVGKVMKTKVQRQTDDIRNAEDLKTAVAEIWTPLQLHYIRSLYDSLPRRLRVVLRARGNITKY
jgi:hypothetical protein